MNTSAYLGSFLSSPNVLIGLFIFLLVFLLFREITTWYFKINQIIYLLEDIKKNTSHSSATVRSEDFPLKRGLAKPMLLAPLIIIGLVLAFVGFMEFIRDSSGGPNPTSETFSPPTRRIPQYRKRERVMNASEAAFFYELQKQLPPGYYAFPNMRIADFIDAIDGKGYYRARNKILPKHIDFLICDSYFKPVVAIEVNGSSHRRQDRIDRDAQVTEIFADAGLPLRFINVGTSFQHSISEVIHGLV